MSQEVNDNAEIIQEFLAESRENMDQMEHDLMAWEKLPTGREMLDQIFRAVHTLKGTCGFLGFVNLETVSHEAESLLVRIREGKVSPEPRVVTILLQVLDTIRRQLGNIERTGEEEKGIGGSIIAELQGFQGDGAVKTAAPTTAEPEIPDETTTSASETSIRVEVGLLDRLMNLVGELVLTRNQITQISLTTSHSPLAGPSQKLSHITSELQESIMKTRLQPIGNIWAKFPRMVRDAAMASGKKIRVEMSGQLTELDKSIIEVIKDPLTHLIRNSIDHGIETPDRRSSAGKPVEGVIRLKAFHEAGLVHVEISDDGGGIRPEIIREAARRNGLLSTTEADEMTNHDLMQLIFVPGFSTAREVTKLSGRGVGMDVVKTNLERISGSIEVSSTPGEGTLFKVRIPLTLAIVPALMVTTGGERFAIPQVNLRELVRLDGALEVAKIETVQDARVYRLRGRLLPLICLREMLGFPPKTKPAQAEDDVVNIIVLESEGGLFGLMVDQVQDTQEIVVKPLGRQLKSVSVFAGATIMGDGLVALILDVMGLAQRGRMAENSELLKQPTPVATPKTEKLTPAETLLLFELDDQSRAAISLSEVTRLEEFAPSEIEWEGNTRVVQYRGHIMPLIPLKQLLLDDNADPVLSEFSDKFQVVVHARESGCYGFLVDRIVDIAQEPIVLQRQGITPGVKGSAVVQRRVTKILDVDGLIALEQQRPAKPQPVEAA